jgi:hypothetical protein
LTCLKVKSKEEPGAQELWGAGEGARGRGGEGVGSTTWKTSCQTLKTKTPMQNSFFSALLNSFLVFQLFFVGLFFSLFFSFFFFNNGTGV